MSRERCESRIVEIIAENACKRVTRQTISYCQYYKDVRPDLGNLWDEICVQVQFEKELLWETYEDTVREFVYGKVTELKPYEQDAVFLQTEDSYELDDNENDNLETCPTNLDSVTEYILNEHVFAKAANWSNARIREYIDNSAL
ncbi:MAG: hypothetical protein JW915_04650 [Chitinispirillaceae bacterium]|nr:hypothetical protein [Chitinispirillaceae bacterium]